jgi:anaerobic selenocysteine-containing dehydrogenase
MPRFADYWDVNERATPDVPFRLATSPARGFLNTSFTETAGSQKRHPEPTVYIHPDDATANDLIDGQAVTIGNHRGQVELTAKIFEGLPRGVLIAEGVHPNKSHRKGRGINTLIGSEPAPPFGGAVFHDATVWIRKSAE